MHLKGGFWDVSEQLKAPPGAPFPWRAFWPPLWTTAALPRFSNVEGVVGQHSFVAVSGVSLCITLINITPQSSELRCYSNPRVQVPGMRTWKTFLMNAGASGVASCRAQSYTVESINHMWWLKLVNSMVPSYSYKSFSIILSMKVSKCVLMPHNIPLQPCSATHTYSFVAVSSRPAKSWSGSPCGVCLTGIQQWIKHRTHLTLLPSLMLALEFKYNFGLSLFSSWLRGFNHIQYSNCFNAWRDFQEINELFERNN